MFYTEKYECQQLAESGSSFPDLILHFRIFAYTDSGLRWLQGWHWHSWSALRGAMITDQLEPATGANFHTYERDISPCRFVNAIGRRRMTEALLNTVQGH